MVSRTQLIIITALLVIALAGPIATMIARQNREAEENPPERTPPPIVFTPLETYQVVTNCTILSIDPYLFAVATSDFGNKQKLEDMIKGIKGIENVNITREENPGEEGLYRYTFFVEAENSSLLDYIAYKLKTEIAAYMDMTHMAATATIQLPANIIIDNKTIDISNNAVIRGMVYPYAKDNEKTRCDVELSLTGGKVKEIVAAQSYTPYYPPLKTQDTLVNGTVLSITEKVAKIEVDNNTDPIAFEQQFTQDAGFNVTANRVEENNKTYILLESNYTIPLFTFLEENTHYHVVDKYYLADIQIPKIVEINEKQYNITRFSIMRKMKIYSNANKTVKLNITIETLFDDVVSVYGSVYPQPFQS